MMPEAWPGCDKVPASVTIVQVMPIEPYIRRGLRPTRSTKNIGTNAVMKKVVQLTPDSKSARKCEVPMLRKTTDR